MIDRDLHRIVIVGGGVAGMDMASTLGRKVTRNRRRGLPISVTLIDRDASHVWKPMLHTLAAGTRDISQQQTPFAAQAIEAGFSYQPGTMCNLDLSAGEVELAPFHAWDGRPLIPARRIAYDTLVLALGSQANEYGTEGIREHCWKLDSLEQASAFNREVRVQMLDCLVRNRPLNIAIVGGGATGVELAAELVQLAEIAQVYGARGLGKRISITLVNSGTRLLAAFPEDISSQAQRRLESLGIRVLASARVKAAHENGFTLMDGREVTATLRIWAAGVKAPDFLESIAGLPTTPDNRLLIEPSLRLERIDNVYALGDCASLTLPQSSGSLPPTAQVASQQARHLSRHLLDAIVYGVEVPAFKFRDFGSLVSIGDYDAYGSLGKFGFFEGLTIRGRLAHLSHAMLYRKHQARVHGFWRGGLLWIVDILNRRLRAKIRLD